MCLCALQHLPEECKRKCSARQKLRLEVVRSPTEEERENHEKRGQREKERSKNIVKEALQQADEEG